MVLIYQELFKNFYFTFTDTVRILKEASGLLFNTTFVITVYVG
jgi:hypothetical protein